MSLRSVSPAAANGEALQDFRNNAPPDSETTPSVQAVTAAARPLAVLQLRAWGRARLWQAGEFDLQTAVDALQEAAAASGLTAAVGQDAVQRILADAFRQVSDDSGAT